MKIKSAIKIALANEIAKRLSTKQILDIFSDANFETNPQLTTKSKIVLDVFSKINDYQDFFDLLEHFGHPLHFTDKNQYELLFYNFNEILAHENIKVEKRKNGCAFYINKNGQWIDISGIIEIKNTFADYIVDALRFFKNEYNKVKMDNIAYEYEIGDNIQDLVNQYGDDIQSSFYEELEYKARAIKELHKSGFIKEYTIESRHKDDDYVSYDVAVCYIDTKQLTEKPKPDVGENRVSTISKEIIKGVEDIFVKNSNDRVQKIEIVNTELAVRNVEENSLQKGKKKVTLPKIPITDWREVEIRFITDEEVFITTKKRSGSYDYASLGFRDDKNNKPDENWVFLRLLSQNGGEFVPPKPIPDILKTKKRIVSQRLQKVFMNENDPFEDFDFSKSYKLKLKLISVTEFLDKRDKVVQDW